MVPWTADGGYAVAPRDRGNILIPGRLCLFLCSVNAARLLNWLFASLFTVWDLQCRRLLASVAWSRPAGRWRSTPAVTTAMCTAVHRHATLHRGSQTRRSGCPVEMMAPRGRIAALAATGCRTVSTGCWRQTAGAWMRGCDLLAGSCAASHPPSGPCGTCPGPAAPWFSLAPSQPRSCSGKCPTCRALLAPVFMLRLVVVVAHTDPCARFVRSQARELWPLVCTVGGHVAAAPGCSEQACRHVRARRRPRARRNFVRGCARVLVCRAPLGGHQAGGDTYTRARVRYESMRDERVRTRVVFEGPAVSSAAKTGKMAFATRHALATGHDALASEREHTGVSHSPGAAGVGACRNTRQGRNTITDEYGEVWAGVWRQRLGSLLAGTVA